MRELQAYINGDLPYVRGAEPKRFQYFYIRLKSIPSLQGGYDALVNVSGDLQAIGVLKESKDSGAQMEQLGKYGFLRRDYLKNYKNSQYQVMLPQDIIGEHLLEADKAAREREEVILKQLEEKESLPDKEADQMAWVRAANQRRAIAEEIILKELIYV